MWGDGSGLALIAISSKKLCLSLEALQEVLLDCIVTSFVFFDHAFTDPHSIEAKLISRGGERIILIIIYPVTLA